MATTNLNTSVVDATWDGLDVTYDSYDAIWDAGTFNVYTLDIAEDVISASDSTSSSTSKTIYESMSCSDSFDRIFDSVLNLQESLMAIDSTSRIFEKYIDEAISAADVFAKRHGALRNFDEPLSASDGDSILRGISKVIPEYISTSESTSKSFDKPIDETFGISESYSSGIGKYVDEAFATDELFDRSVGYNMYFAESISAIDICSKSFEKPIEESFGISDSYSNGLLKAINELISTSELSEDQTSFSRAAYETITFSESVSKQLTKSIEESLSLNDYMIQPYIIGVISDIGIKNIALDVQDIQSIVSSGAPAGFNNWEVFSNGDYTYREALFQLFIEDLSGGSLTDVEVIEHNINCDVEDVVDKGTVNISGIYRVYFNKTFHAKPVVTITSFGVTDFAIPEIVAIEIEYFDVRLKKIDNSNATGQINWSANGY